MLSLRQRLTRQAAWAVLALVWGFGAVTWLGMAWHFYALDRGAAEHLAMGVLLPHREVHEHGGEHLNEFRRTTDAKVWVIRAGTVAASPNARGEPPPAPGLEGLGGPDPRLVVVASRGSARAVVAWPLLGDWDALGDLATVLLLLGVLAGVLGAWLARWATTRMLVPVVRMVQVVEQMVRRGHLAPLPTWSDSDDEFNRLTHVLNRLLQQVAERSERERQFLAQAAHELRTPLQVLQGNLEMLGDWSDPAVREESLEQSRSVVRRMVRMVADLLTLERAQGAAQTPRQAMDLGGVVEGVAEDAQALALSSHLRVTLEQVEPLPIEAVPWAVERALWAVVDNALKYTPAGGEVVLRADRQDGWAVVTVRDTGPGIAAEELPHLFERFWRGTEARGHEGSGLGLAIARALVEQDGGQIAVTSQRGVGTTVRLAWPLVEP
ncbi:MAG: HAMP domain-containing histidine kinase [Firmicutes bacterium]|nr:HAMP domain-containing histidine kinase [Alicyclobacillaceae bacterium]MCL6497609.1 HAMP domain-containing histidine kinase [Bacillota bacterium]